LCEPLVALVDQCGKHDPGHWELVCRCPLGHGGLHDWEAPYGPGPVA
jgi:hypothetical protein